MRDKTEFKLHRAIMYYLMGENPAFHHLFATTIYQGRDAKDGFFLKMLGVQAGMPDIVAWYKGGCSFIEVKTISGRQSSAQKKVQGRVQALGFPYVLVRSVQDVHDHLLKQGLRPMHKPTEPDLRSDAQKKKDAFDFYKRC